MEQSSGFYETKDNVLIPECMVQGSLQDTIDMTSMDNPTYHYLMTNHVYDVQRHLYRLKRMWPPQLKRGERIVDLWDVYDNPFNLNQNMTNDDKV